MSALQVLERIMDCRGMQQRAVVSKEQVGSVSEAISLDTEDSLKVGSKVSSSQIHNEVCCNTAEDHVNSNSNNSNVDDVKSSLVKFNGVTYRTENIEVVLEGKTLWDEFYRRGTEMIVNRAGRRMFPGFSVAISSLKPKVKYSMTLEVVLADNHRFKFLNSRWLAVGSAEPQPLTVSYVHPDSPNSGAFWMRHGVSFRKLKITNNKEKPGKNALLYSMHKYFLRLVVEEKKISPGEERSTKIVLQADFPETTFVAVTAYQNEEVTQLKITNNPFAKAFRENTADTDWEAAQLLYSNQGGVFPPLPQQRSENLLANNSCWTLPSPPTPSTLPPLSGFMTPNAVGCFPQLRFPFSPAPPSMPSPYYFQWPGIQPFDLPTPHYTTSHKAGVVESPVYASSFRSNLPDFETVFTTLSN